MKTSHVVMMILAGLFGLILVLWIAAKWMGTTISTLLTSKGRASVADGTASYPNGSDLAGGSAGDAWFDKMQETIMGDYTY